MRLAPWLGCLVVGALAGCGNDAGAADADPDGFRNGCPSLTIPVARPGDPADGDTWDTYARDFFATWCTRCHSVTRTGTMRNNAPDGLNWDDEASVRGNLNRIRDAVGVFNYMPFNAPFPTCDERRRIVRWIDVEAP